MTTNGNSGAASVLLAEARAAGIALWVENGQVKFRAPKGGLPDALLARLRMMRDDLVILLRGEEIRLADRGSPLAVSFAQERLWFLDQLDPGGSAYNMPAALRVRGKLDVSSLARAVDAVLARHEALRTTFDDAGGTPVQRIGAPRQGTLQVEDAVSLTEEAVRARAQAHAVTPFDLRSGPLFTAVLLRRRDDQHLLLVNMHHIVSDGWSIGVLASEILSLYSSFSRGAGVVLPELEVQYADYASWQRKYLSGARLDEQLTFWKRHLEGAPAALELPGDRPRPPTQTFRGATLSFVVPQGTSESLHALSRQHGATLFMTLLASFAVFLSRHSGQRDVVIGTPIAGRTRAELEPLIGLFVNTLALRTRLEDDPSFAELLTRTKASALDAFAHQDLPFEKLVEAVNPPRDMSRSPVFQVMFALQNNPRVLANGDVSFEPLAAEETFAKFDLMLDVADSGDTLNASFNFNADLFDAATIERFRDRFLILLESALRNPHAKCSSLDLLPAAERRELLQRFSGASAQAPAKSVFA